MASIRSAAVPEPGSNVFSVIPELAGLTRSGKKRLLPPEESTADTQTIHLPDRQGVTGTISSADSQDNLVPGETGAGRQETAGSIIEQSASKEQSGLADTQVEEEGGQGRHQSKEVVQSGVHSVSSSESEGSDNMSETSDMSEQEKLANAASDVREEIVDDDDEVLVVEASPTLFNPAKLPKTMSSSVFKAAIVQAQGTRAKILKALGNMDKRVEELENLEQEGDDSDDEYEDSLRREVGEEMAKVKSSLTSHEEVTCNIRVMCGFMMER